MEFSGQISCLCLRCFCVYGYVYVYVHVCPTGDWLANQDVRCAISHTTPGKVSLQQCAAACGKSCPFFLYYPDSTYKSNCWLADATDTLENNCRVQQGSGYVLYTRKWKRYPGATATGGTLSSHLTLASCKESCKKYWQDCVGFSRYNPKADKLQRGADDVLARCWWVTEKSAFVFDGHNNDKTLFISGA